ncbi:MAG: ethylbenzene dehydrogenase-related protein [Oligoflexia bacterium]|nr:ethylbenzene dehydrogenase-related protein [Oligoflexia bacterium]
MRLLLLVTLIFTCANAWGEGLVSRKIDADLSRPDESASYWSGARAETIQLMGQPMIAPRPKTSAVSGLSVQSVHNGKWIAFRLSWKDPSYNEAGKLGEFSDAVAIEFPVKSNETPPPVFMGGKDDPVHVFHWRAQYQRDAEKGKPTMKELYPNMSVDAYPLEFVDSGKIRGISEESREAFSPAKAQGNPQSYAKTGVDELLAEGFGTSSVLPSDDAQGRGRWRTGEWSIVIARKLTRDGASKLEQGKSSFVGFALWDGGSDEVGSRKSVTMSWTPLSLDDGQAPKP